MSIVNWLKARLGKQNKAASGDTQPSESSAQNKAPVKSAKARARAKKRRRWLIAIASILALVLVLNTIAQSKLKKELLTVSTSDILTLANTDFYNTVNATGIVESDSSHKIYSTKSYAVKHVLAEVGDYVMPGDLLCELDSSVLENQIEARELALGISAKAAAQQVKTARDNYNAAKTALDNGLNQSLVSADSAVNNAYNNWQKAQRAYDNYLNTLDSTQSPSVKKAENALDAAQSAYDAAKSTADAAKAALDAHPIDASGNQAAVDVAQAAYDTALAQQLLRQSELDNALAAYQSAHAAYTADPSEANNQAMQAAQTACDTAVSALNSAEAATAQAEATLKQAKDRLSEGVDSEYQTKLADYNEKKAKLDAAAGALSAAKSAYNAAINADNTVDDLAMAVDMAYSAYQSAVTSYNAASASAGTSLQASKNSLSAAEISANTDAGVLELAQLQEDLDATKIYSDIAGTVTAVYASEGSSGAGLLFVIEDIDTLIVETSIKEYDIGDIRVGIPVSIKSDATGDDEYEGVLTFIAPTSKKNAQGNTDTMGEAEFAAEVKVTSQNTGLRIGMSVRVNYILDSEKDVLTVPYSALYSDASGEQCILVLDDKLTGEYALRELRVQTGMESDTGVVVSGEGLTEGLQIITAPDSYRHLLGQTVTLVDRPVLDMSMYMFG